jgi:hypothetical protein
MSRAAPPQAKPRPVPGRIGGVLAVLRTLIAHARYFAATAATRAAAPEFLGVAAVFGTHEIPVILHRVQRGILRALALQQYLLDRAARGRNLRFAWPSYVSPQPHHRPPAKPARAPRTARTPKTRPAPDPATLGPDDPDASRLPTQAELEAWVRRRPVGRSMAYICLDLGIFPCLCDGAFWNKVHRVLSCYGGSLNRMYQVRERGEEEFQRERDRRPETWHIDWRDVPRATLRAGLGCLIGEPVPSLDGGPMPGLPAIVPS